MTHVRVWRGEGEFGFWHHGIELSNREVVHYTVPRTMDLSQAVIKRTCMDDFCKGGYKEEVEYPYEISCEDVEERAMSMEDVEGYNLVFRNCETFATWCMTGYGESHQVQRTILGGCMATACVLAGYHSVGAALCGWAAGKSADYGADCRCRHRE